MSNPAAGCESYADGDIRDWTVDWTQWKSMPALSVQRSSSTLPSSAPATPTDAPTLSGTPSPSVARPGG